MRHLVVYLILFSFSISSVIPQAIAQELFLPPAQATILLSPAYTPCQLRGIKIDSRNPFKFDFVVEEGDSGLKGNDLQEESRKLIKYFLATVTTPAADLWVNLSPYEDNRIIPEDFGRTAMGRDLLAQDYILKQVAASLMHPDSISGKEFWAKVYKESFEKFGTTDIPVDTFNKVWIVPQSVDIDESNEMSSNHQIGAYIHQAKLKVLLELDYLAASQSKASGNVSAQPDAQIAQKVMRQVIVPILEKEVNEGKNFALLRQIYHSLLLAVWLKKKLTASITHKNPVESSGIVQGNPLALVFLDQHKTGGLETSDPQQQISKIYTRYVEAFKKGAYNIIREDYDTYAQELIPRKYFTGGATFTDCAMNIRKTGDVPIAGFETGNFFGFSVKVELIKSRESRTAVSFKEVSKNRTLYSELYIQMNIRTFIKVVGGLVILTAIAPAAFTVFTDRMKPAEIHTSTMPGIEQPQPSEIAKKVVTKGVGRLLEKNIIKDILEKTIMTRQQYDTGNLHNRKGIQNGLHAKGYSVDEVLIKMGIKGNTPDNRLEEFTKMLNEIIDDYGAPVLKLGISSEELTRLILSIVAKESWFDRNMTQIVNNKVQARGLTQFEFISFSQALKVASRILKEKTAQGITNYDSFYSRVQEEMRRELGDKKNNTWLDNDSRNIVSDSKTHLALTVMWLGHITTVTPMPQELELARLDNELLKINTKGERPPSMNELLEELQDNGTRSADDLRLIRFALLASRWNGGINPDKELQLYWLKLFSSSDRERRDLLNEAGQEAYELNVIMKGYEGQLTRMLNSKKHHFVFVASSANRKALIDRINKILDEDPGLRKDFDQLWISFRNVEKKYRNAISKLTELPKSIVYTQYHMKALDHRLIAVYWRGQAESGERSYIRGCTEYFLKKITGYTPKSPSKILPYNPGSKSNTHDNAMGVINKGGIDFQTDIMDFNITGNAGDFQFDISEDNLDLLKKDINGLEPLIISVKRLDNVPMFLGLTVK